MSNGSDDKSIPWQVRSVFFMGVPSALAIYFAYVIVTSYFTDIKSINNVLIDHNNAAVGLSETIKEEHIQHKDYNTEIIKLLLATCVNNAKSELDRNKCLGTEPLLGR